MNTNNTITRRNLLAAAPAAAIAVAIPMKARASDLVGWGQAKADYRAAEAVSNTAIDQQAETERALFAFQYSAPTERVTYTVDAWSNGAVMLAAHQQTVTLTQNNYRQSIYSGMKNQPEYHAYCERLAAWENDPEHVAAKAAYEASDKATGAALNAQHAAWQALVDFPLHDATAIADKLATAFQWVDEDPDMSKALFQAMAADLGRASA